MATAKGKKKALKKSTKKKTSNGVGKSKKKVVKKKAQKSSSKVSLGSTLPDLKFTLTGNKETLLSELRGKKLVLYFYPKDSTPGCTVEGHDFTRLHKKFKSNNAEVYGVSRDSLASHEKFKAKECYSLDLISDQKEELCQLFGVIKMKNMYGKQVRGIERSTFVIDEKGCLEMEWRGVKVEGHAQEVLDYILGK
ncbi:MAG: peroxiredoxin [Bdellovibrionales bacterium]|nr:peroxiredoxin [Bdellovibrionales bacterium]